MLLLAAVEIPLMSYIIFDGKVNNQRGVDVLFLFVLATMGGNIKAMSYE